MSDKVRRLAVLEEQLAALDDIGVELRRTRKAVEAMVALMAGGLAGRGDCTVSAVAMAADRLDELVRRCAAAPRDGNDAA